MGRRRCPSGCTGTVTGAVEAAGRGSILPRMPDDARAPTWALDDVVLRIAGYDPELADRVRSWRAATALVLAGRDDPAVLFIERAQRPGDRWSGQMALPGGRAEPGDRDLAHTAARETREEVGVELGDAVGRLDDVHGRVVTNAVSTYVHALAERPLLRPKPSEVQTALWIPVSHLLSPAAAGHYRYGGVGRFPAVVYDRFTIWGLTYRIVENFARALGTRLPAPRRRR